MPIRTLFMIILKVLGLFFLRDFLVVIPQLLSVFSMYINFGSEGLSPIVAVLLSISAYGYVAFMLIFRTVWVIDNLNLDKGFEVDAVRFNMHRSTVLSICIIVVGAIMFINAIPPLIKYIIEYYQSSRDDLFNPRPRFDWLYIFIHSLQVIIGLLLMGHQRQIVSFIELRRRNQTEKEEDFEDDARLQ